MLTETAGGVVMNERGEVAVANQRGDSWSLPKGHVDAGETLLQAAMREITEETGITDLTFVRELGSYERFRIGKGGIGEDTRELKRITLFLFRTTVEHLAPLDPDNPVAKWVPIDAVAALLTHPKDREFFEGIVESLK